MTLGLSELKEALFYNPETGDFIWKEKVSTKVIPGRVAGYSLKTGYKRLSLFGKKYNQARLAWFYNYGYWPNIVDHIDGDRSNNRLSNLRDCDYKVNNENKRGPLKNNKLNTIGVSRSGDKYYARIQVDGVCLYLGTFNSASEAHFTYLTAKRKLHVGCTI